MSDFNVGGLGNAINQGLDAISAKTNDITAKMNEISNMSTEDQQSALLKMQFEMGQYNAVVELTGNIVKTLSDNIKSAAQKI